MVWFGIWAELPYHGMVWDGDSEYHPIAGCCAILVGLYYGTVNSEDRLTVYNIYVIFQ